MIRLKLSANQASLGFRTHNIISGIKASERNRIEKKSQEMKQIVDSDDR